MPSAMPGSLPWSLWKSRIGPQVPSARTSYARTSPRRESFTYSVFSSGVKASPLGYTVSRIGALIEPSGAMRNTPWKSRYCWRSSASIPGLYSAPGESVNQIAPFDWTTMSFGLLILLPPNSEASVWTLPFASTRHTEREAQPATRSRPSRSKVRPFACVEGRMNTSALPPRGRRQIVSPTMSTHQKLPSRRFHTGPSPKLMPSWMRSSCDSLAISRARPGAARSVSTFCVMRRYRDDAGFSRAVAPRVAPAAQHDRVARLELHFLEVERERDLALEHEAEVQGAGAQQR